MGRLQKPAFGLKALKGGGFNGCHDWLSLFPPAPKLFRSMTADIEGLAQPTRAAAIAVRASRGRRKAGMEKGAFPTRRQEGPIGDNRDNALQETRVGPATPAPRCFRDDCPRAGRDLALNGRHSFRSRFVAPDAPTLVSAWIVPAAAVRPLLPRRPQNLEGLHGPAEAFERHRLKLARLEPAFDGVIGPRLDDDLARLRLVAKARGEIGDAADGGIIEAPLLR